MRARPRSRAPSASSPRKLHPDANKHDPKAAARFAELNAAYEILGDEDKRKAFDRGEIDAEGKPRFQGFEGFGGAARRAAASAARAAFRDLHLGPGRLSARAAARRRLGGCGGFEDILKDMFGGAGGAAARRRLAVRAGGFRPRAGAGRDVTATVTITLPEAAKGAKRRVQLPTGKEVDVKIPAGLADGQQIRLKGQGLPGPGGAAATR